MKAESPTRAVAAAAHPVVLAAAALIVVNDFALRGWAPGWLTGKLSDVGWLVVTPVLLAALLTAARVPARLARPVALAVAGVVYVTLQLWPPLGAFFRPTHVADAADLLVLPALFGAVLAWRSPRLPSALAGWLALPALAGALVADSWSEYQDASFPCGDGMEWDANEPLVLQLGGINGPPYDTDAFLRGIHLADATGAEVKLVATRVTWGRVHLCARDGLRGDTDYTWTIGPWDEPASNEVAFEQDSLPTVTFRTLPGDGPPVGTAEDCAALAVPFDTGGRSPESACGIGHPWHGEDTGRFDTGDTGPDDTDDTDDTDTGAR